MSDRLKLLICAYACEPGKGSEPGVGWNRVRQAARRHEVWVITRESNRDAIRRGLEAEPMPNVRWCYYDLQTCSRGFKKWPGGVHVYYYLWQKGATRLARTLHREVRFDLLHHVTFVNYWLPSVGAFLPVPFIWGPVGGGESAPSGFYRTFGFRGRVEEHLRDIVRRFSRCDPWVTRTAGRAAIALATSKETARRLRDIGASRVEVMTQLGLDSREISQLAQAPLRDRGPFRVISMGRLVHWKGFHLGLQAFATWAKQEPEGEYWIVGDGVERSRLERLARRLGIDGRIRLWGALPRTDALNRLGECDVLLHPSLHDSGGGVCLEAMAAGRPVVCLDLGGPGLLVDTETGIKVRAIEPEQSSAELARALQTLSRSPGLRLAMAMRGRRRVAETLSWSARGDEMDRLYRDIAGGATPCGR